MTIQEYHTSNTTCISWSSITHLKSTKELCKSLLYLSIFHGVGYIYVFFKSLLPTSDTYIHGLPVNRRVLAVQYYVSSEKTSLQWLIAEQICFAALGKIPYEKN